MSTIAEQLAALAQIKEDIRQAIIDKGVDVPSNTPFTSYASLIGDISGGGGIPGYEFKTQLDIEVVGEVNE